jgi:hypothetical protein
MIGVPRTALVNANRIFLEGTIQECVPNKKVPNTKKVFPRWASGGEQTPRWSGLERIDCAGHEWHEWHERNASAQYDSSEQTNLVRPPACPRERPGARARFQLTGIIQRAVRRWDFRVSLTVIGRSGR